MLKMDAYVTLYEQLAHYLRLDSATDDRDKILIR